MLHILISIEDTLTGIDALTAKYGLQVFEEDVIGRGNAPQNELVLPLLSSRGHPDDAADITAPSEALRLFEKQTRHVQSSTSIRRKFKWAIKDRSRFELLLERIRYYNDSLYSLLPKESIDTITRDVLANLINSTTPERLTQFRTVATSLAPSEPLVTSICTQYAKIASAAEFTLHIANSEAQSPDDVWIDERSIAYDGQDSDIGTLCKQGRTLKRVIVQKLRYIPYMSTNDEAIRRKTALERVAELALLLREPRFFGFATLPCLGVVTNLFKEHDDRYGDMRLVYEIPNTADPLEQPVSLHDMLTAKIYHCEDPPNIDVRLKLASTLAFALHEMHCTGWLHRNISSKDVFFLKVKSYTGLESLDLEKPYVTGFDAARPFTAFASVRETPTELAVADNQHPGYVLRKYWTLRHGDQGNTGDKLFYMSRHDYYSMGLVFLDIGMWQTLESLVLRNPPFFELDHRPSESDCSLDETLVAMVIDTMFARVGLLDDPDPSDEQELDRRKHLWAAYIADGSRLIQEEGLVDFIMDKATIDEDDHGTTWAAWDVAYGVHKLREDALRVCREKLGSRMGRRYREAVRRCLATDFGLDPQTSKNADWLRAFNWKVLQDLNRCCT